MVELIYSDTNWFVFKTNMTGNIFLADNSVDTALIVVPTLLPSVRSVHEIKTKKQTENIDYNAYEVSQVKKRPTIYSKI